MRFDLERALGLLSSRLSRIGAVLVLLGCLLCDAIGVYYLPGYRAHNAIMPAGALTGLALAWTLLSYRAAVARAFEASRIYYTLIALLAVALPALVYWCGMRQFGGFDYSVLIDAGWRIFIGQRPVTDFPATLPISLFLGAAYAYWLFGVSWSALTIAYALFCLVTFLWSLRLLQELVRDRALSLILSLAIQGACVISITFWWYNPLALTAGVVFTLSAIVWLRSPASAWAWVSYFAALVLLATMKPNLAGLLVILDTAILLSSRAHRWKVLIVSVVAFLTLDGILYLQRIDLIACMLDFARIAERGLTLGYSFRDLATREVLISFHVWQPLVVFVVVLIPFLAAFRHRAVVTSNLREIGIGAVCILGALNSFLTAADLKVTEIATAFIGAVLIGNASGILKRLFADLTSATTSWLSLYTATLSLVMAGYGLGMGVSRERVLGIGPRMFFDYKMEAEPFADGFFRGMYCSKDFKEVYAQTQALVSEIRGQPVTFGPRMQWAYAAFNIAPPKKQPILWVPGTSYALRDEANLIAEFLQQRSDPFVFWRNDMTFFSPLFQETVKAHYRIEPRPFPDLTIYRPK